MNEPELIAAFKNKSNHQPRTRYWTSAGQPKYTNTLIRSESPYLLQHAHNPVDWLPWGEEAFALARDEQRPIFLSIGYSTCHWCQVMARETFEDEELAEQLNTLFVPIKVDREEWPDVDAVYMEFLQITTGAGGWPMNVFLTPERRPLFATTYLPPRDGDRGVKVGVQTYLKVMAKSWQDPRLVAQGEAPLRVLRDYALQPPVSQLNLTWLTEATQRWMEEFDADWGGFTEPPKFLRPAMLEALLRAWHQLGDPHYLEAVEVTLERIYCGGIYDQIGGGIARYSVDNRWWLPHFEKMLYDNAQLVLVALEIYQITRRPLFAQLAHDTLQFLERELQMGNGAWAAALDAESMNERAERVDGHFYTWRYEELKSALQPEEFEWVVATFGIEPEGNLNYYNEADSGAPEHTPKREADQTDSHATANSASSETSTASEASASETERRAQEQVLKGRNLLRLYEPLNDEERAYWEPLRKHLYQVRAQRTRPARDEQAVCAWSALTLSAFARAATVLATPRYAQIAKNTARFLTEVMWDGATLKRVWRPQADPQQATEGVLEDYMASVLGLLDYFESSGEITSLHHAIEIYEAAEQFFDQERGGFFRCPLARRSALIYAEKPLIDGVEPSGNALAALAALRLYQLTHQPHYRAQADSTLKAIGPVMSQQPTASPKALSALATWFNCQEELIILQIPRGQERERDTMSKETWQRFLPYSVRLSLTHVTEQLTAQLPALAQLSAEVDVTQVVICNAQEVKNTIQQVSTLRTVFSKLDA